MADVQWIKIKVGMFDGDSFKKIKRAKIGGEKFRDKLTAVWFELMEFAGRCNHGGAFIDKREIPYKDISDIATMIDRDEDELQLCMSFFINEGMIEIIDDVYMLSNWCQYQHEAGLEKIREQKRIAQANWRAKKKELIESRVDSTVDSTNLLPSYSYSSTSNSKDINKGDSKGEAVKHKYGEYGWVRLTDAQYAKLLKDLGQSELDRCIKYVDESAQGNSNKNKWSDWNLIIRKCHREQWGIRKEGFARQQSGGVTFAQMREDGRR